MTNQHTPVWDLFIRIFHWTLVASFIVSFVTEGENNLHFYSGWYIALLIALRLVWGVIGSQHARFRDFIYAPTEIIEHTKSLLNQTESTKHYRGHNPLGGLMVFGLIASLGATTITGIMLYQTKSNDVFDFMGQPLLAEFEEEKHHPIKGLDEYESDDSPKHHHDDDDSNEENHGEEWIEELHEFFANVTLLLILLHIAGVVLTSRLQGENLVKAMITGKKDH